MPTQRNRRQVCYGYPNPQAGLQQEPHVDIVNPTAADTAEIGTIWVNTAANTFFILVSSVAGVNTWQSTTGGAAVLAALTVNPGDIDVTAGDVNLAAGDLNLVPASTATLGNLIAGPTLLTSTLGVTTDVLIGGTLGVTGNVILTNDLTVNGDTIINGDFDITSADALSFTTTSNTDPAISFTANGGAAETIILTATQGTAADSVNLVSTVGGITLTAGLATADSINIATPAAGGIDIDYGTAGMDILGGNGAYTLATGTGAISVSADAAATTLNLGTGAAVVKTINIGGTGANVIAMGNTQTAGSVAVGNAMTTGTITIGGAGLQTGLISLAPGTGAQQVDIATGGVGIKTVNIATGAIDNVVSLGTASGAASLALRSGTGNMVAASTGTLLLDSAGVLEINSSAGAIGIGNDAVAQNINIGTGAAARTIIIGNQIGATEVDINSGTNGMVLRTTNGALFVITGTGNQLIGTDATDHDITIGANAGVNALTLVGGTGGATLDAQSISLDATTASNFTVTGAGQDLMLSSILGSVHVMSTENIANNVWVHANGGINDTLVIQSEVGTAANTITVQADQGGINIVAPNMASNDAINLNATAGGVDIDGAMEINIASSQAAASSVVIAATNAAGGIAINSGTGATIMNSTGATTIDATTLSLDATLASNFTVTGAGADLALGSVGGSVAINGSEAILNAISLTAPNAASGITITAGTAGIHATAASFILQSTAQGAIHMYTGAGDPGVGLATTAGDFYFKTNPAGAADRIFVATGAGVWTNLTCAA